MFNSEKRHLPKILDFMKNPKIGKTFFTFKKIKKLQIQDHQADRFSNMLLVMFFAF